MSTPQDEPAPRERSEIDAGALHRRYAAVEDAERALNETQERFAALLAIFSDPHASRAATLDAAREVVAVKMEVAQRRAASDRARRAFAAAARDGLGGIEAREDAAPAALRARFWRWVSGRVAMAEVVAARDAWLAAHQAAEAARAALGLAPRGAPTLGAVPGARERGGAGRDRAEAGRATATRREGATSSRPRTYYRSHVGAALDAQGRRRAWFIRQMGVSEALYYAIEAGRRRPTPTYRRLASKILGVPEEDLFSPLEPRTRPGERRE